MKPTGLIEIILYVQDMQAQVRFYRDQLGLVLSYPQELVDYSQEDWVTFETGACTLALHSGGKRRQGEDAPKIVFGVDDIQAARDHLISHGFKAGAIRSAAPGILVCDGFDPEGNPVSFESREDTIYG
jgi:catechol 2,3-dioxygenase-like lactoylglutathione lyase family enzyme